MSVWGPGVFENDDALDWVYDLVVGDGMSQVAYALDTIIKNKDYSIETYDCRVALVAAEIIAVMNGNASPDMPEELEEWIGDAVIENENLRVKAEEAVIIILKDSEQSKMLKKIMDYTKWKETLRDLLRRLEL